MARKRRQPEEAFQEQVIQLARLWGWRAGHFRCVRVARTDGSVYYQTPVQADGKGFPDLILLRTVRMIAAELKVPPNRPTPEQLAWLADFAQAGVETYVWEPAQWDDITKILAR